METLTFAFIAALVVLLSVWILSSRERDSRWAHLKPLRGPRGLPLIGYLPFLTAKPYVKLVELAKEYGPVYSVRLGSRDVVCLCDFKSINEAFAQDALMGRPPDFPFFFSETTLRLDAFNGMPWKYQRRFCLHQLKDLGLGKTAMEGLLKEEILDLLDRLQDVASKGSVNMSEFLTTSISNNIASLLFGRRMLSDDPKRIEQDRLLRQIGHLARTTMWQQFFPWIKALVDFFKIQSLKKLSKVVFQISEFCKREVEEHEATLDADDVRDFVDGYLLEIQKKSDDPHSTFHKDVLVDLSRVFFTAGSEPTRISADWTLLICAAKPEVQVKIEGEIEETLGAEGFPTWQDRLTMPYTEAVICEMWRWTSMLPINIMRYTLEDTEINGYFVPKNTSVLANLHAVSKDERLWGPGVHEFRPERFLSEDGKKVDKPEHFIPFSIGKRSCPGKLLAEIEVFLYVVAILQRFRISLPPGKKADFEGVLGINLQPKKQELCLELRHSNNPS